MGLSLSPFLLIIMKKKRYIYNGRGYVEIKEDKDASTKKGKGKQSGSNAEG